MEEGSLRIDVNTSLAPRGFRRLGTRTATNVNSLRSVERAVCSRSSGRRPFSTSMAASSRRPALPEDHRYTNP